MPSPQFVLSLGVIPREWHIVDLRKPLHHLDRSHTARHLDMMKSKKDVVPGCGVLADQGTFPLDVLKSEAVHHDRRQECPGELG